MINLFDLPKEILCVVFEEFYSATAIQIHELVDQDKPSDPGLSHFKPDDQPSSQNQTYIRPLLICKTLYSLALQAFLGATTVDCHGLFGSFYKDYPTRFVREYPKFSKIRNIEVFEGVIDTIVCARREHSNFLPRLKSICLRFWFDLDDSGTFQPAMGDYSWLKSVIEHINCLRKSGVSVTIGLTIYNYLEFEERMTTGSPLFFVPAFESEAEHEIRARLSIPKPPSKNPETIQDVATFLEGLFRLKRNEVKLICTTNAIERIEESSSCGV